jgi:hypothetical protein
MGMHAAVACVIVAGQAALSHPALRHAPFTTDDLLPYQKHVVLPWVLTAALVAVASCATVLAGVLFGAVCCLCSPRKCKTKKATPKLPEGAENEEKDAPPKGSAKNTKTNTRQRRSFAVLHNFTKTHQ